MSETQKEKPRNAAIWILKIQVLWSIGSIVVVSTQFVSNFVEKDQFEIVHFCLSTLTLTLKRV